MFLSGVGLSVVPSFTGLGYSGRSPLSDAPASASVCRVGTMAAPRLRNGKVVLSKGGHRAVFWRPCSLSAASSPSPPASQSSPATESEGSSGGSPSPPSELSVVSALSVGKGGGFRFGFLNVRGAGRKFTLHRESFLAMCRGSSGDQLDVLVLAETHSDDSLPPLSGFPVVHLHSRPRKASTRPADRRTTNSKGGLAVLLSARASSLVSVVAKPFDGCMILNISKLLPPRELPTYLFCCYMAPATSEYGGLELWDALADQLLLYCTDCIPWLLGDFNAHLGELLDYLTGEEMAVWSEGGRVFEGGMNGVDAASLPIRRSACLHDPADSVYGARLIEICKAFGVCIVNGRGCGPRNDVANLTWFHTAVTKHTILPDGTAKVERRDGTDMSVKVGSVIDFLAIPPGDHALVQGFDVSIPLFDTDHAFLSFAVTGASVSALFSSLEAKARRRPRPIGRVKYVWPRAVMSGGRRAGDGGGDHDAVVSDFQRLFQQDAVLESHRTFLRESSDSVDADVLDCRFELASAMLRRLVELFHSQARKVDMVKEEQRRVLRLLSGKAVNPVRRGVFTDAEVLYLARTARHLYRLSSAALKLGYGEGLRASLLSAFSRFRARRNKAIRRETRRLLNERLQANLRDRRSNPARFWSDFMGSTSQTRGLPSAAIDVDTFRDHFERVFSGPSGEEFCELTLAESQVRNTAARAAASLPFCAPDGSVVALQPSQVREVFKGVNLSSSPGVDGLRYSVWYAAGESVFSDLSQIFSVFLQQGRWSYPHSTILVTPLPKKGDLSLPDNWRGIHLLPCVEKLFGTEIRRRIEGVWTPCPEQAGFRAGHSTIYQCFILHALIQRALRAKRKLYVCFVDFKKAFDTVHRDVLWAKMRRLGIPEYLVRAVEALYERVVACMDGGLDGFSSTFQELFGVKQGDVLGPLLFLLLIDDLPSFLREFCSFSDAETELLRLGLRIIVCLLFADDAALIGETPEQLQKLLDGLHAWSMQNRMVLSRVKTSIVVFGRGKDEDVPCFYYGDSGVPIPRASEHSLTVKDGETYLGMYFHEDGTWGPHMERMVSRGLRASCYFWQRVNACPGINAAIRHLFYEATVQSVVMYGVELYAAHECAKLERIQAAYLRRSFRLPFFTKVENILAETGRLPVEVEIVRRLFRFIHRVAFLGDSSIVWHALDVAHRSYRTSPSFWAPRVEGGKHKVYAQRRNWFSDVAKLACQVLGRPQLVENIFSICTATTLTEARAEQRKLDDAVLFYYLARDHGSRLYLSPTVDVAVVRSLPFTLNPVFYQFVLPLRTHTLALSRGVGRYAQGWFEQRGVSPPKLGDAFEPQAVVVGPPPPCSLTDLFMNVRVGTGREDLVGRGQGWLHRLVQPIVALPRYLQLSLPGYLQRVIMQLRIGILPIAVSLMRKEKLPSGEPVPREQRFCPLCLLSGSEAVEDELHFLFFCPSYTHPRVTFLQTVVACGLVWLDGKRYLGWPDLTQTEPIVVFVSLLFSADETVLRALGKYLVDALRLRSHILQTAPSGDV